MNDRETMFDLVYEWREQYNERRGTLTSLCRLVFALGYTSSDNLMEFLAANPAAIEEIENFITNEGHNQPSWRTNILKTLPFQDDTTDVRGKQFHYNVGDLVCYKGFGHDVYGVSKISTRRFVGTASNVPSYKLENGDWILQSNVVGKVTIHE